MPTMMYDKLEEVPEDLRGDAKEIDGKFHLDGTGLLNKNKQLLGELQTYKTAAQKLKEFGEMDPVKAKAALEEMTHIAERKQELEGEISKAVQGASQDWQRKVGAVETERDQYRSALEKRVVDLSLQDEITKAEGNPDFVAHHLRNQVKAVLENGEYVAKVVDPKTGLARVNSKGEPMTINELVGEAKADKRFAGAFLAPNARGSGAPVVNNQNQGGGKVVTLTREQAKDARQYRAAMAEVGGDATKIVIKD